MAGMNLSIDQTIQKPQSYASDGTDAIGFIQFWGLSPARDLIGDAETLVPDVSSGSSSATTTEQNASGEAAQDSGRSLSYNVLVSGGADVRHVLKTASKLYEKGWASKREVTFYLHDQQAEVAARHILFLHIINNRRLTPRDRAELFLSLYGNSLVRERDAKYRTVLVRK